MGRERAALAVAVGLGAVGLGWWAWRRRAAVPVVTSPTPYPVRYAAEPPRFGNGPVPPLRLNVHASLLAAVGVAASETGLPLVVVAGERTDADAALVWSWGRVVVNPYTGPLPGKPFGDVATNARTVGDTAHGRRGDGVAHALDVHPDETRGARRTVANYTRLGEVWRRRGLLWGGDFTVGTTRDWPHVETRLWRQLPPKGTT